MWKKYMSIYHTLYTAHPSYNEPHLSSPSSSPNLIFLNISKLPSNHPLHQTSIPPNYIKQWIPINYHERIYQHTRHDRQNIAQDKNCWFPFTTRFSLLPLSHAQSTTKPAHHQFITPWSTMLHAMKPYNTPYTVVTIGVLLNLDMNHVLISQQISTPCTQLLHNNSITSPTNRTPTQSPQPSPFDIEQEYETREKEKNRVKRIDTSLSSPWYHWTWISYAHTIHPHEYNPTTNQINITIPCVTCMKFIPPLSWWYRSHHLPLAGYGTPCDDTSPRGYTRHYIIALEEEKEEEYGVRCGVDPTNTRSCDLNLAGIGGYFVSCASGGMNIRCQLSKGWITSILCCIIENNFFNKFS